MLSKAERGSYSATLITPRRNTWLLRRIFDNLESNESHGCFQKDILRSLSGTRGTSTPVHTIHTLKKISNLVGEIKPFRITIMMNKLVNIAAILSLFAATANAGAVELTLDNFNDKIAGKNGFVKFQAPW